MWFHQKWLRVPLWGQSELWSCMGHWPCGPLCIPLCLNTAIKTGIIHSCQLEDRPMILQGGNPRSQNSRHRVSGNKATAAIGFLRTPPCGQTSSTIYTVQRSLWSQTPPPHGRRCRDLHPSTISLALCYGHNIASHKCAIWCARSFYVLFLLVNE